MIYIFLKIKTSVIAVIIVSCVYSGLLSKVSGQVIINEYSCSNMAIITDNYGDYEDWVELYNTGAAAVNLAGYQFSDDELLPGKWIMPSVSIPANGYLIIFANGRGEVSGGYGHANFKLTQTNQESIVLSNPSGILVDTYPINKNTQEDHSRGRITDGSLAWGVFTNPTPGSANTNALSEYATKPIFNQLPGYYGSAITVSISTPGPGADIYYTTDGNEPTTASTLYLGPVNVSSTMVIRAKAFSNDTQIPNSFIETNTYFIGESFTLPVYSISGGQIDNLLNGSNIEPPGAFEYFDENLVLVDEGYGDYNKHGNDSWAYDQRGFDYISRDQYGYNHAVHDQIFRTKSRSTYQRLIFKAAANDNYPFEDGAHIRDAYVHSLSQIGNLRLDERSHESCIVFVNGEYWGVYDVREKVDDNDFTDYYYNQDENNLQYLKTWGGTWSEYGGAQAQTDWDNLSNFILGNDMTNAANFMYVDSLYNWKSLIDYVVLNSYVVCSDWLNWNTSWWRGMSPAGDKKKWRYSLWDMDATFGHYINYTGVPDQSASADPCNPENLNDPGGQGHIPILNKLMDNPTFYQYYVSRFIDLSNTVFSCEFMQAHLDSLIAIIEPEMQEQINQWGGSYSGWQSNVQELKDFIDSRCADLSGGMIDCYSLTGPFDLTIMIDPPEAGTIELNSLNLSDFPWTGSYYGGIDIRIDADPKPCYVFDYWEINNHTLLPSNDTDNVVLNLLMADTIIAHFTPVNGADIGNDTTLCSGNLLYLDAGSNDATASYIWQDGSTDSTFAVSGSGTYSVTVQNAWCTLTDEVDITYFSGSSFAFGNDTVLCTGDVHILDAGNPGSTYIWSDGSTNQTLTVLQEGNYSVTVSNQCGSANDAIYIAYESPPVVDIGDNHIICEGDTLALTPNLPGMYYSWQNGNTNQVFSVTNPGTYSVTVDNGYGCKGTDNAAVTVISASDIHTGPDMVICKGVPSTLTAIGGTTYEWSPAESLDDPYSANPIATPLQTTVYAVSVSTISGCSFTDYTKITVIPDVNVEIQPDTTSLCPGEELLISIYVSEGTGGPYYIYNDLSDLIIPPLRETFYESTVYKVYAKDACQTVDYDSIIVNVLPVPDVSIAVNDNSDCIPFTVEFSTGAYGINNTYLWRFDDNTNNLSSEREPVHTFNSEGIYTISLEVTNEYGCDSTLVKEDFISANPVPEAIFGTDPPAPSSNKPVLVSLVDPAVRFINESTNMDSNYWLFGDGSGADGFHAEYKYKRLGIYDVTLVVTTIDGCSDTAYSSVKVEEQTSFYAPDAFIPGESGKNGIFKVYGNAIKEETFNLVIYDRWGEIVFQTFSIRHGWDGTIKNRGFAPAGVYTWLATYTDSKGEHQEHGSVTVIR